MSTSRSIAPRRAVVADRGPASDTFASTIVRAGLETPREWTDGAVRRPTGGAGRMWGVAVPFRAPRTTALVSLEPWYGLPVTGAVGPSA